MSSFISSFVAYFFRRGWSLFFLLACTDVARAGSYGTQAFTFATGTKNLGDSSVIASNDGTASVQANALRLTANGVGDTTASFKLPDLDAGKGISGFDVTFKLRLFTSGTPADGFALNFGSLPADNGRGESGFTMQNGLSIAWDTYNNGNDVPSIEIFANGISVGNFAQTFSFDGAYRTVSLHWDSGGLDVTYNGVKICSDLPTPGFIPSPGNRFGFSARTGGSTEDVYLDDLLVATVPLAPTETGGPVISEFVADNGGSYEDEDDDTSDWIEIYNGQNTSVNLNGWTLTHLQGANLSWTFPSVTLGAYQYLVVFASGKNRVNATLPLHTNFTLPKEGGYLALVKPGGTVIASQFNYAAQESDVSYGESGSDRRTGYIYPATPGTKNSATVSAGPPAEEVVFSREGGLISGTVSLEIATPVTPGAVVRYTLNNTEPSEASAAYAAPFSISNTATVRARVFAANRLPGPVGSRTFLRIDTSLTNYNNSGQPFSTNLPIVVLDSFGSPIDTFTGVNDRGGRLTYGVVIPPDPVTGRATITGLPQYQGRSGTNVRGESSAGFPQRQYAWEIWNNEDQDKSVSILGLPAQSDWVLYAPWSEKTLMRDVLVFGTMRKLRGDYMASRTQFVEVFFNQAGGNSLGYSTSYRGVYVLKEKIKIDKDRVDIATVGTLATQEPAITGGYIFRKDKPDPDSNEWTTTAPYNILLQTYDPGVLPAPQLSYLQNYLNSFQAALAGGNFTHPTLGYANYIEPDTFIDAQWFAEWTKQVDGYIYSTYFHKDRGKKLRAGPIWDFNIAVGNADYGTGNTPTGWLYDVANGVGQLWYPRLHQDASYRLRHWDRFWEMRRGVLATNVILGEIDRNAAILLNGSTTPVTNSMPTLPPSQENAVRRHYRKYPRLGQYDWPNPPGTGSRIYYNSNGNATTGEVDYMKNWLQTRLAWLDDQNRVGSVIYRPPVFNHYGGNVAPGFQWTAASHTGVPPTGTTYASGTIYYTVDNSDPRAAGGGISASAKAYTGAVSLTNSTILKARLHNSGAWSPLSRALFVVDAVAANASNLVVSEIHYQPQGPSASEAGAGFVSGNEFEFVELLNVSDRNVDLSGVTVADGIEFNFANADPATLSLPPGGRVVLVGSPSAFLLRYGNNPTVKIAGTFSGNLSNSGEQLTVRAADQTLIAQFTWGDGEPWPVAADGAGYSLVLDKRIANPAYSNGASWRASAAIGGGPGLSDGTPFAGTPEADTDRDGHSDLLEYAMGSDRANPASLYKPAAAVAPYTVDGVAGDYFRFQYRRNLAADGCTYTVFLSDDAMNWKSDASAVTYVESVHNGDGTATVTYRSTRPCNSVPGRMFMRLQVAP
ncbi:MAG: CotH kinase family protein [Verrucomicrobiota bacterium]